jgi:peroxiredoxin
MNKIINAGKVVAKTMLASSDVTLQVGDAAPNFIAASTRGEIELSRTLQNGPVVLALYPADFTPG